MMEEKQSNGDPEEQIEVTVTLKGRREYFEYVGLLTPAGKSKWAELAYLELIFGKWSDDRKRQWRLNSEPEP